MTSYETALLANLLVGALCSAAAGRKLKAGHYGWAFYLGFLALYFLAISIMEVVSHG